MLERLEKFVRFVSVILLICSAAAILTMPLVIGYSTIARYLVGYPLSITEEFSSFLLVSCVFLALPYAAMEGKHVKFSMFLSMMSERQRVYCELITNIAAFLFMLLVAKLTLDFTILGYVLDSHSATARLYEAPWRAAMPLSSAWLAVVLLLSAAKNVRIILGFQNKAYIASEKQSA